MDIMDYELMLKTMSTEENFYYDMYEKRKHDYPNNYETYLKQLKKYNFFSPFLFAVEHEDKNFLTIKDTIIKPGYNVGLYKHFRFCPEFPHKHDYYEIIYAYKGSYVQEIYGEKLEMRENTICIIPPKMIHTVKLYGSSAIIDILVRTEMFDRTFMSFLLLNDDLHSFFIRGLLCNNYTNYILFNIENCTKIQRLVLEMFVEYNLNNKYSKTILNGIFLIFLGTLMQNYESSIQLSDTNKSHIRVPIIFDYLEKEYNSVTLDSLATHFNYNKSYMSKLIKKLTGKNFTEIIQDIKMRKACELLRSTNLTVNDLANHLGYNDVSYFSSIFKKTNGVLPSQYKK